MKKINIEQIEADPNQPRKIFTGLEELAASIKEKGLLEPITVRPAGNRFIIVMGERRYRASRMAGLTEIDCQVKELTENEAYQLALVENVQRENLTVMEEAKAFKRLQESGLTQEKIAQSIGKGQSYIAHKLRLLRLPEMVQAGLDEGKITEGHARQIARIESQEEQERAYNIIIDRALSVKNTVNLVNDFCGKKAIHEQIKSQTEIVPDIDLLKAQGIKPPESYFWTSSVFDLHGNKFTGTYARFMYLIGRQYSEKVFSLGFNNKNLIDLEMAIFNMRRKQAESIDQADLIFIDLGTDGDREFKELQSAKDSAFFVVRSGPKERTVNYEDQIIAAAEFMHRSGMKFGPRFICELPEIPEEEAIKMQAGKKNVIWSFEDWVIGSMSRDIIYWNMAAINKKQGQKLKAEGYFAAGDNPTPEQMEAIAADPKPQLLYFVKDSS